MSRRKVKEERIGSPVDNGSPYFIIEIFEEFLCEGDAEPFSIEHEIPFNSFTKPIKDLLKDAGCWRKSSDRCWRYNSKNAAKVKEVLLEALEHGLCLPDADCTSEASSPVKHLFSTPDRNDDSRKRLFDAIDPGFEPMTEQLGFGATLDTLPDGRCLLRGPILRSTEPLLLNILRFRPTAALPFMQHPNAASTSEFEPLPSKWVSSWPLTQAERSFVISVLKHRLPVVSANQDQLVPIPEEAEPVPGRFRPRDSQGCPLNGPYITWATKKPYNVGRQYFSSFSDDKDGFIWADGTGGKSAESKQRAEKHKEQREMLHLLGQFDTMDPCEMYPEGSDEWDGCGCCKMEEEVEKTAPKVVVEV